MILKEEEAKAKWCSHVRHSNFSNDENASNRYGRIEDDEFNDNPEEARCIASECMQWRWATKVNPEYHKYAGDLDSTPKRIVDKDRGYCGPAGKPDEE